MAENEQKRICFLKVIKADKNEITVGEVANLFALTIGLIDKQTQTFKNVKEKLGEDQYIRMMTSLVNSFLSSLYINGAKNEEEQMKRYKEVKKINEDLISYEEIKDNG